MYLHAERLALILLLLCVTSNCDRLPCQGRTGFQRNETHSSRGHSPASIVRDVRFPNLCAPAAHEWASAGVKLPFPHSQEK